MKIKLNQHLIILLKEFNAEIKVFIWWKDPRIVFKNLRTDGNYLNKYWQDQIWLPPLYFSNTRGNAPILGEDSMTVEILQQARVRIVYKMCSYVMITL